MPRAVIVDAVRTPVGKRGGKLAGYHPVDLAALTLRALAERSDLDPGLIDDVIMGCVTQTGEQGLNVGRNAALAAGFPEDVVGVTIDRQCGSGQQAAHFAAQGVMAGVYDAAVAAGVESMTRVPMGATAHQGPGRPFGPLMTDRYAHSLVPQGPVGGDAGREVGPVPPGPGPDLPPPPTCGRRGRPKRGASRRKSSRSRQARTARRR